MNEQYELREPVRINLLLKIAVPAGPGDENSVQDLCV